MQDPASMPDGADLADHEQEIYELYVAGRRQEAMIAFRALINRLGASKLRGFDEIYDRALCATDSCPVPLRRRSRLEVLVNLLQSAPRTMGAIAECGCFRGLSSYLMCSALRADDPTFDGSGYHIFDSFQGLSEPTAEDDVPDDWHEAARLRTMSHRGHFAASLEQVRANLAEFPGISYHPGWIPLTFKGLPERVYRFVHLDVDLYDPTLDGLMYFFPRLVPGGTIVSDDYSWPGARAAIDEFCAEHGIVPALNPHGQAVIVCSK